MNENVLMTDSTRVIVKYCEASANEFKALNREILDGVQYTLKKVIDRRNDYNILVIDLFD